MNRWKSLTKVLLKTTLGSMNQFMGLRAKNVRLTRWSNVALYLFLAVCMVPAIWMLGLAGYSGYDMLTGMGQEGLVVSFIGIAGSMATLVMAIPMILSIFYMSRDVELLLPLPLRSWEILGAKFAVSWIYEVATMFLFLLPPLIGYGLAAKVGAVYWVCAVLGCLVIPVVPMACVSVILMLIMRLFKGVKNKDLLNMVTMVLVLVVSMVVGFFTSSMESMDQAELIALLSAGDNSLLGMVKSLFPHLILLERALVWGDLVSMLLFLAASAGFVMLFLLAANALYFEGVAGMNEATAKRRKITDRESIRLNRQNHALASYAKKEERLLLRTPVYFLNCAMLSFLWPLLVVLPALLSAATAAEGADVGELLTGIQAEVAAMAGEERLYLLALALFVVFCMNAFSMCMSLVAGSSISREGQNFTFMKYIPLSYRQQIQAKLWCSVKICSLGTLGYTVILAGLCVVLFGLPVLVLPLSAVLSGLLNLLFTCVQMFVDLWRPRLTWETETQAVKQNFNALIEMAVMAGAAVALGFLLWKLFFGLIRAGVTAYAPIFVGLLIVATLTAAAYAGVLAYGAKRLDTLE